MDAIGRRRWAIAEGYIPSESSFSDRALTSHETACILNAGDRDAQIAITIFFANKEPVGPYRVTVPARRTLHLRFNDLSTHSRSRATPTMPRCSSRTCRSSCSIPGWIRDAPRCPCCRRSPTRKAELGGDLNDRLLSHHGCGSNTEETAAGVAIYQNTSHVTFRYFKYK